MADTRMAPRERVVVAGHVERSEDLSAWLDREGRGLGAGELLGGSCWLRDVAEWAMGHVLPAVD